MAVRSGVYEHKELRHICDDIRVPFQSFKNLPSINETCPSDLYLNGHGSPIISSPGQHPSSSPSPLISRSPPQLPVQCKWGIPVRKQNEENIRNINFPTDASYASCNGTPASWNSRLNNQNKCYYEGSRGNSHYSGPRCPHDCEETAAGDETVSTRSTATPQSHISSFNSSPRDLLYRGPEHIPVVQYMRIYDSYGPISFETPSVEGGQHSRAELRQWPHLEELIISQNSSKRKVHRGIWLSPLYPELSFPVAVKFVEDNNSRDGRSIKREIECHLFLHQRLQEIQKVDGYPRPEDAWPSAELLGYHLDKRNPGRCMLVTRKLSGPDFFDVIRQEHSKEGRIKLSDEFHKLHWCSIALKRVQQYARLGIRHNDIKPDNIVIDWYINTENERSLDVKIIDLGTASMFNAKDFTGGTSWYESPEQKTLEYYSKKQRNQEAARKVDIGLASDVWAAGLSITEVLVGKRVVDALKHPHGPGPLDYRGPIEGWAVEPEEWIQIARDALLAGPRRSTHYTFCYDAAKWIFDNLVRPDPNERATLQDGIDIIAEQSELALLRSKRTPTTRSMA